MHELDCYQKKKLLFNLKHACTYLHLCDSHNFIIKHYWIIQTHYIHVYLWTIYSCSSQHFFRPGKVTNITSCFLTLSSLIYGSDFLKILLVVLKENVKEFWYFDSLLEFIIRLKWLRKKWIPRKYNTNIIKRWSL